MALGSSLQPLQPSNRGAAVTQRWCPELLLSAIRKCYGINDYVTGASSTLRGMYRGYTAQDLPHLISQILRRVTDPACVTRAPEQKLSWRHGIEEGETDALMTEK